MKRDNEINWAEMGEAKAGNVPEFDYYRDLVNHISPANYMEPYIIDKVEIANNLYAELQKVKRDNISELVKIRRKSEELLGINYDPDIFYLWLLKRYSPKNYLNPYNEAKFRNAHRICSLLTVAKDNYAVMEDIWVSETEREDREERERLRLKWEQKQKKQKKEDKRFFISFGVSLGALIIASIIGSLLE